MHDLKALPEPISVNFSNGEASIVTRSGSVILQPIATVIYDVLLVPTFKFNLLSISKLASQTNSRIHFTTNECLMQGQSQNQSSDSW